MGMKVCFDKGSIIIQEYVEEPRSKLRGFSSVRNFIIDIARLDPAPRSGDCGEHSVQYQSGCFSVSHKAHEKEVGSFPYFSHELYLAKDYCLCMKYSQGQFGLYLLENSMFKIAKPCAV